MRASLTISILAAALAACGTSEPGPGGDDDITPDASPPLGSSDPLQGLPTGTEAWTNLCAKGYGDMISAKLCAGTAPPTLTSIKDLQQLLGLGVVANPNRDPGLNANVRVTLTGHSTGLGLRAVTPLNPRAFVMTPANANGSANASYQVLSFARGEPLVELVANDPAANTLRFFLIRFHLGCETAPAGCSHADLLTPTIESGWTGYDLYDDVAIQNTTLDCLNCHQAGGPGTRKILRMQELANPWAHWFYEEHAPNLATMNDFHAAHGTEDYAGIPNANINPSRPAALQRLLQNNGFAAQPNGFDTTAIETELAQGSRATWNALYAKAVAGLEIPVPYFAVPTDPAKVAAAITAYQQTQAGTLPRDQMPDIADILLDSALADMSIRPKPGLDGAGILQHMCRMCHNDKLDPSITRARFDVANLAAMSRAEKDEAIRRLRLPEADARHMPPARFHVLSAAELDAAIQELSR
jgi:hypothetical protein